MAKETFTTFEISRYCNVFVTTVANWIDEGKLPAYRTPGGHRRVMRRDLLDFMAKYNIPVPDDLSDSREMKVLVVDDDADMVQIVTDALLRQDPAYVIRTADNGFEAGKQVATFRPHVVILDVVLPGLDGLQVCRNLRQDPLTRDIRVIVISGRDVEATSREFSGLGVEAFLQKP